MTSCQKNFCHIQKFQKQAYNKNVKPKNYILNNKIWLNNKYIKIKKNYKLKFKFFSLIQVLYLVEKQAYKLKQLKK